MELIMEHKISPAQYRAMYRKLIGDESLSDNQISKEIHERYKLILKVADSNVICDLRVHNHRKSSFDMFWKFTEQKIEELTAVNDRRHSETTENGNVVVNLALALSVRDLYEKCKVYAIEKGVTEENIPSLSWFRFQFWPKSSYMATAMNYTGQFNVRFMVQQHNIRKFSPDDHYCNALFKYAKQLAIKFSDHCAFISTDDKCKIKLESQTFRLQLLHLGNEHSHLKSKYFKLPITICLQLR